MLARVLDKERLDSSALSSGLLRVDVPVEWLEEGGTLVLDVPKRVSCAACEGGGCGRCDNAGAFRVSADAEGDAEIEPIRVSLAAGDAVEKRVRLPSPFGEASTIELLIVVLRPADEPSAGVRFEAEARPLARMRFSHGPPRLEPNAIIGLVIAATVVALVVILSLSR